MLAGQLGELLVERERGGRAGRVVRVARPEHADLVPAVERVEIRQPAELLAQRELDARRAGEERAALVDRIGEARDRNAAARRPSATCANEKIASFDPSVGTISTAGSTSTPNRLAIHPATASRYAGSPTALG